MSLGDKSNMDTSLCILFCFLSLHRRRHHHRRNDYQVTMTTTTDIIMSVGIIATAICAALTAYRMYFPPPPPPPPPPVELGALERRVERFGGALRDLTTRVARLEAGGVPQVQAPAVAPIPAPSSNTANGTQ
jgi:hypothetical protein